MSQSVHALTIRSAESHTGARKSAIESAKQDGRWEAAYDSVATASVPEDLARALDDARVSEMFASLDSRNRYAILHRVQTARKPETRARRIAKYVAMLKVGEKPYP